MRIVLLLVLFVGCGSNSEAQKNSEAEKNAERRHNEMMAEMESAHLARLEAEKQALIKKQSEIEDRAFELKFQK